MFKQMLLFIWLSLSFISASAKPSPPGTLHPDEKQSMTCRIVAEMISTANYKKVPLADSLSEVIFARYLETLDPAHNYFLQEDIVHFEPFKTKLDDGLRSGDLGAPFEMFNTYRSRYRERLQYAISKLEVPRNFNSGDVLINDRQKLPYATDMQASDEIWNKRVTYDLLKLRLTEADMDKNRETLRKRYQNQLLQSDKITARDAFQLYMNAVTASVDPHISFFNPFNASQFNIGMSRSLEGIGATLALENELITVKTMVAGGPAAKSRLLAIGDRIVAVAQGQDGAFQDIAGWRVDDAIGLIRGNKSTVVRLKVLAKERPLSAEPSIVTITRDKIILEDQSAKKEVLDYRVGSRNFRIGVISIPQFYVDLTAYGAGDANYKSTTRDVGLLLDTLKKMKVDGIVIDLRQNGGGSLTEAIDLTGLFISSGPVVQVRDIHGRINVNRDQDPAIAYEGPLAVLVNRYSASASEIFSAAIQDYHRGIVIGSQTYGKGTVQTQINLDKLMERSVFKERAYELMAENQKASPNSNQSTFGQLNLTTGKFYRVTGGSTQHQGVTPDIILPGGISAGKYGEDAEPSALLWDTIPGCNFSPAPGLAPKIAAVSKLHRQRFEKGPIWQYYQASERLDKEMDQENEMPLNESFLKGLSRKNADALFERNNLLRSAMGLPSLKKGQVNGSKDDLDLLKREAGRILVDFL